MKENKNNARNPGLNSAEFEEICDILGKEPTIFELSVFAVIWKERYFFKILNKWLKKLPVEGENVITQPEKEKAGIIKINDELAIVSKIASRNYFYKTDPYRCASVLTGSVIRNILSNCARPSAILSSLCFGDKVNEETIDNLKNVVNGISDYCSKTGVPVAGGEFYSDRYYSANPIVNVMAVGIARKDHTKTLQHPGMGNKVYIAGAFTAPESYYRSLSDEKVTEKQKGSSKPVLITADPNMGHLLIEAVDEVIVQDILTGIQDVGITGIAGSVVALLSESKNGMKINLEKVPLKDKKMDPLQIILSVSQERMVMVIKNGKEKNVEEIFEKWNINYAQIGTITANNYLEIFYNNEQITNLPVDRLVAGSSVLNIKEGKKPDYINELAGFSIDDIPEPEDLIETAHRIIRLPNIISGKLITERLDNQADNDSLIDESSIDASQISIKGSRMAIAMTVDCNARYVFSNPVVGAQIAVAEAVRNIICSGGIPLAATICLNFGDPDDPEVFRYIIKTIEGIGTACRKFGIPVSSSNISSCNQTSIDGKTEKILPAPVIGMTGILREKNNMMTHAFKSKGSMIYLIGKSENDIASSQYLINYHHIQKSPPPVFDLEKEYEIQMVVKDLIRYSLIRSAHDVSEGGLFIALAESGFPKGLGFDITIPAEIRRDAFLFGESQGRVMVTVSSSYETEFIDFMLKTNVPFSTLGHVTKGDCRIDDISFGSIDDIMKDFDSTFENLMNK
ncbi:MAG: phosphoribosylformylglycinamidine synthase subunit PurL [Bacteroidetes bacterium]|nr:phosphoribosylformylglycinamidine synthase subunit PurL [Bacteroidota bacterium]